MLFYTVIKPVVQVALRVFFRHIEVRHRDRLNLPGPLLFAGNHPNTLMDPLLTAIQCRQPVAFLAKSTFFQNPILRAIMESGNSIPIYRRHDAEVGGAPATAEQVAAQNEASFGRCYDYLSGGGTIMIFPEGSSVSERRLRPLKTGAARIALGAEARHHFKLGLRVVPIAINYFDPSRFRSDVLLNVATPIVVADYAELYAQDPEAAADQLTDAIREALERRLVITRDAAEDVFVQQVERTFGDHLNPNDDASTLYDNFQLSQTLLQALAWFEQHAPSRLVSMRLQFQSYLENLRRYRLTDDALESQQRGTVVGLLNLVFGAPVWLYGVLNNYLPYILPSMVAQRATKDVEFVAPIMLVMGMLTFPLAYTLQAAAVQHWLTHDWRLTALYVLSLPLSGFYALSYWETLTARLDRLRALRLFRSAPAVGKELLSQRATLVEQLEEAREAYLARVAKQ
ncbi:lysophospholipid acyltransferase family protein [Hymenobacter sp. BT770]|uniref:lysophospholipid acyltransferase family protein n=1 Tax=Hymenobacter sp. BT770 TaxID=2886942 RepID=UPI001D10F109|nr:lysophospholipid acyltransferase family protein [Hymenobacter sp. BT770]MCC3154120.1 lysophospholipid acyltransferase family protein [Hymenobacter sp. BT770]MDO3414433.1 lysophospholipid acyltransferase family protein [Hymenobacter sp. BT770]